MDIDQPQQDNLRNRVSDLQDEATEALHRADMYVRENPVPTVLGALALGFVIGILVRPSEPTPRSRWNDAKDYAGDVEDQLRSLLNSIAKKSKKAYKKSSSAVRDAVEDAADAARD